MNDMIKAEREKIFSRKPTRILLIMGLAIIVGYFFLFTFNYNEVFYNYNTGKMDVTSGFAAVEHRKETAADFQGELTSETLSKMQERIDAAKADTIDKDENSAFSAVHVYRDQSAMLEYLKNPDGSIKPLTEAYPKHQSIILGYCDGWDKMLSAMGSVTALLMCLLIVIALSPIFSEDYAHHTDSVIYAARYGRSKLVSAKIIASLEAVLAIYFILLLLNLILYGTFYGLQGWNVSIQASLHYASSTYNLTFLQMFLISVAFNVFGIVVLTVITLLISAKMNSPVTALICSFLVCFVPVLFDFTDSLPFLQKVQELCPIYMLHVNGIFAILKTYAGLSQPVAICMFNLVLVLLLFYRTKEIAKRHQVVG